VLSVNVKKACMVGTPQAIQRAENRQRYRSRLVGNWALQGMRWTPP